MKKIFIALLVLGFLSSYSFAARGKLYYGQTIRRRLLKRKLLKLRQLKEGGKEGK